MQSRRLVWLGVLITMFLAVAGCGADSGSGGGRSDVGRRTG